MQTHNTRFTVQITLAPSTRIGKLAEGQLAFKGGPLDGLSFGGFTVWASKSGHGENVTFPGRPYTTTQGEKKTFSFLHGDGASMSQMRHVVLEAYRAAQQSAAPPF